MIQKLSFSQSCPNFGSKKVTKTIPFTGPHFWPKGRGLGGSVKNRTDIRLISKQREAERLARLTGLQRLADKALKLLGLI